MNTKQWLVDNFEENSENHTGIKAAAEYIKNNELIAFPTETVYGLGANAWSEEAVQKVFKAKGRPSDNPLIVHISNMKQLVELVDNIPENAQKLINEFWPGALTIIFKRKAPIAPSVTAGLSTIAVRMPDHPVALALIETSGCPLAAPSANKSGKPSPTMAEHVYDDLSGEIAGILDGGPTGVGVESTVIDCTGEMPIILRPGGITKSDMEAIIGDVEIDQALLSEHEAPRSPGMKYTHYAPDAPMVLVNGTNQFIQQLVNHFQSEGKKVGVLTTVENHSEYKADVVISCGTRSDIKSVVKNLYQTLRSFNKFQLDIILCESFPYYGIGEALMNRLMKAAGGQIINEE